MLFCRTIFVSFTFSFIIGYFCFILFYFLNKMFKNFYWLIDWEREKHRPVVPLIYALIGWFLYVPWLGIKPATLAHQDSIFFFLVLSLQNLVCVLHSTFPFGLTTLQGLVATCDWGTVWNGSPGQLLWTWCLCPSKSHILKPWPQCDAPGGRAFGR